MSAPRVLNFHRDGFPAGAVDIMRPGPYGNPFILRRGVSRASVLNSYLLHLAKNEALQRRIIRELRGKDLVCCCAPKVCHGDTMLELANQNLRFVEYPTWLWRLDSFVPGRVIKETVGVTPLLLIKPKPEITD